jgi:hypothetical protein
LLCRFRREGFDDAPDLLHHKRGADDKQVEEGARAFGECEKALLVRAR